MAFRRSGVRLPIPPPSSKCEFAFKQKATPDCAAFLLSWREARWCGAACGGTPSAATKRGPPQLRTTFGRARLRPGRHVPRSPLRPRRSAALASFGFGIFLPVLLGECPKRMPAADGRRRRARDGSPTRPLVHDAVREFGPHPVFGFRSNSCKGWRPEPRTRKQGRLYHERGHAVHRR